MTDEPNVCQACFDREKKASHYISPTSDRVGAKAKDCYMHPRLDNRRLVRCLGTLTHWGHQEEGWSDRRAPTPISRGAGWVARRSAMCILFDHEAAFIDFMLKRGLLEGQGVKRYVSGVLPEAIRTTPKGEDFLAAWATANSDSPLGEDILKNVLKEHLALRAKGERAQVVA